MRDSVLAARVVAIGIAVVTGPPIVRYFTFLSQ